MRLFSWRFIRLWQRNGDVFRRLWRSEAPGFAIEPIIILIAFGFGFGAYIGMVDGQPYIEFIAPGIVVAYAMYSATFECTYGSYARLAYQNTYDAILATPLSAEDITAGEIFWGATRSMMTGSAILAISAAFRLVPSPWAMLIPLVIFLEGLMFGAISLSFTSLVPAISTFNYLYTLFINPMFFLSGVFFPLSAFPEIIQSLSWVAPLTPVVHITRALFQGSFHPDLILSLVYILAVSTVFFAMALVTMRRRLTR